MATHPMLLLAGKALAGAGALGLALNEVRGIVLAGPIFYTLWTEGGTGMQILLAVCSLLGIAASVLVPLLLARLWRRRRAQ